MKAENVLATMRELYKDEENDKESPEYKAIYHSFCFVSYNMKQFQQYLDEVTKDKNE